MRNKCGKLITVLLGVILTFSLVFSGCAGLFTVKVTDISFSKSEISLELGNRIELNRYVKITPSKATKKGFTAESDDESVIAIEVGESTGSNPPVYAHAVGVGEATITVTTENGKSGTATVKVNYAQPDDIIIVPDESLNIVADIVVMNLSDICEVRLTAALSANVDPDTKVAWSVEEHTDLSRELKSEEVFAFTPGGVGQNTVVASVSGEDGKTTYDKLRVNVYEEATSCAVEYDSRLLLQDSSFCRPVSFVMNYTFAEGNPEPIIQWLVNGEEQGNEEKFDFLPSEPGKYVIEGKLNGVTVEEVTVWVRGTLVPQSVYLDYDDCYPSVFIRWDSLPNAAGYEISVTDADTGREVATDLDTGNTAIRDKFTDSGFDATDFLTGTYNIFNTRFRVKVRTLGEGSLDDSQWSAAFVTDKVPEAARPYLEKKFYDGARNYYVKSYEEFYEWFEYAMLWRPVTLTEGETLYLDYEYGKAVDTIERAMQEMHFTGLYSYGGQTSLRSARECTFKIVFTTEGTPSQKTSRHTGKAWHALRPHVNYDSSKARPARYVFPIDNKTPVSVSTTDQLYYVAQLGYRPVPKEGSAAEKAYNYARRIMRYIVTDDMTDAEKLHAIYDWIMWRVIYDNEVLEYGSLEEAVKFESYYLESVFTDYGSYGVCDAMSKAFVLMSAMEGFESVRVTGQAGSTPNSRGGHAWNKVKLEGNWYVVDCTWGDASMQIMSGGDYRESASHAYFLLSDADIASTHVEDVNSSFPRTASTRYPWYDADFTYKGKKIDFYLGTESTKETSLASELSLLADYMIEKASAAEKTYSVGPDSIAGQTVSSYYGFEIVVNGYWGSSQYSPLMTNFATVMASRDCMQNVDYFVRISVVGSLLYMSVFFVL